ncbi:hypothetical protein BJ508DRAFT_411746 [Ascobolus immersus RN42]|uniref:Uncharacterized protein n=1 Tax=Ascobolus immersus RN42 TaxID=1160509 RepID=A0A3N4IVW1_ASCIM|nr:hypothetical protein BJ508DRAFT_411746 [Ascobolus immersus RN42]
MARKKSPPKHYGAKTETTPSRTSASLTPTTSKMETTQIHLGLESFPECYRDSLKKMQETFPNGDMVDFMVVLLNAAQGDVDLAVQYFARNYVWNPVEKKYQVQHGPETQILNEAQRISSRTRSSKKDSQLPQTATSQTRPAKANNPEGKEHGDEADATANRRQTRSTAHKLTPVPDQAPNTRKRTRSSASELASPSGSDSSISENQKRYQQFLKDQTRTKNTKRAQEDANAEADARKKTRHSRNGALEAPKQQTGRASKFGSPATKINELKKSGVEALRQTGQSTPDNSTGLSPGMARLGRLPQTPNFTPADIATGDEEPLAAPTATQYPQNIQLTPDPSEFPHMQPSTCLNFTPTNFLSTSTDTTSITEALIAGALPSSLPENIEKNKRSPSPTLEPATSIGEAPSEEGSIWAKINKVKLAETMKDIDEAWGAGWEDRFFNRVISTVQNAGNRVRVRGISRRPMSFAFAYELHKLATCGVDLDKLAVFLAEKYVSSRAGSQTLGVRYYLTVTDLTYASAHMDDLIGTGVGKPIHGSEKATDSAAKSLMTPPASQQSASNIDTTTSSSPPSTDDGFSILDPFINTTPTPTPTPPAHPSPCPSILLPQYQKTTNTLASLGRKVITTLATKPYTHAGLIDCIRSFFIVCERTMRRVYDVFVLHFRIVVKELERGTLGMAELAGAIEGIVVNTWENMLGCITTDIFLALAGDVWKVDVEATQEKVLNEGKKGVALVETIVRVGGIGELRGEDVL